MAIYPKQLQPFTPVSSATGPGGSKVRDTSFGDHVVFPNGNPIASDITVNKLLRFIEEDYTGYLTTLGHTRREPRFRPFDTPFGDVVVFANGSTITGDQYVNELIEVLRVLWDIDRAVAPNQTGLATSVQN